MYLYYSKVSGSICLCLSISTDTVVDELYDANNNIDNYYCYKCLLWFFFWFFLSCILTLNHSLNITHLHRHHIPHLRVSRVFYVDFVGIFGLLPVSLMLGYIVFYSYGEHSGRIYVISKPHCETKKACDPKVQLISIKKQLS